MAVFKCKMCGGNLDVDESTRIVECEYCGSVQTTPSCDDEKKINLFNRANRLRTGCEFDRAASVYESIVAEYPNESEAYWGLCLCKYGIEYVDDPTTAKKIPTCHRTELKSIFDNQDYLKTIDNADTQSKELYIAEAKVIDSLQQDILDIAKKEKPFDVFICYKETDENGGRTEDSVLAQEIYDSLVKNGLNVFFSRITLEDKLGQEYEPYIFSALNSSKVMLAIGTSNDNFEAVWVKNEWSRFLSLMSNDKSKKLIPCYKDIDPYDMPEEFKKLQAQDMSKIGFVQDITRGVQKLVNPNMVTAKQGNEETTDSMLEKIEKYLEDGEWGKSAALCEQVLMREPECAKAYVLKLLTDRKLSSFDALKNCKKPFSKTSEYKKAILFADEEYLKLLQEINNENKSYRKKRLIKKLTGVCVFLLVAVIAYILIFKVLTPAVRYGSEKNNLPTVEVGNVVQFGKYKWIVLDKQNDKVLLFSYKSVAHRRFDDSDSQDVWEDSDIRDWLNNNFYKNAFSVKERKLISKTSIYSETFKGIDDEKYIIGNTFVEDYVFLLSYNEANKYRNIYDSLIGGSSAELWILRSPYDGCVAACEGDVDGVDTDSAQSTILKADIRPAMWVNLDALNGVSPSESYDEALSLIDEGDYASAYALLKNLNYEDSEEKANQILAAHPYINTKVGDVITFGTYDQDLKPANGNEYIEWLVVDKEDDAILLVSEYLLDKQPFNTEEGKTTWKTSSIRTWLNDSFLNTAFSKEEQALIKTVTVTDDADSKNSTEDKIFLLSKDEANEYFKTDDLRICQFWISQTNYNWWLRPTGTVSNYADIVDKSGAIPNIGYGATSSNVAVRPAFWLDINSGK